VILDIKVSIIITAHNYGKWLPQAIDSALGQNFDSFEVIVVNDGSTDDTPQILENYKNNRRIVIVNTDGIGLSGACNRGIEKSVGNYIVRLDADDWFDPNLVLVLANFLDYNPNIGLVFCDYIDTDVYGEIINYNRRESINDEIRILDRSAPAAGAMYRRHCYETIGGYNEEIRYQEDYDFWLKIVEKFQVRNISLPLMFHRLHGNSMSRNFVARMKTRRYVKKEFLKRFRDQQDKRKVLAIIPARADMINGEKVVLTQFDGSNLLTIVPVK
jgi:glycosyltransferase involved in cell wall biosynthesis